MDTNVKGESASTTSDQPTRSKKTCSLSVKQEWSGSKKNLTLEGCLTEEDVRRMEPGNMKKASDNSNDVQGFHGRRPRSKKQAEGSKSKTSNGLESDLLPKSFLTGEDRGRMVREQLELAKSPSPDLVVSRILNALKSELVPEICSSLEATIQRVIREELRNAPSQSAQPVRSSGTCREKNEERNFKLQFITKPPAVLYTGDKLKGERGNSIAVVLINAETGTIVESGPESSIKLKVVMLEGGFEKEDADNWTQEEFGKFVLKEREGRRPLLRGKLVVTLNRGTGMLGDLEVTDNSKWTWSGQFRIALQAPPEYCENIREAITEAFTVNENRGKLNMKHFPPSPNDDVWRLKNIARNGARCRKLNDAGIYKVEELVQQHDMDSEKLRKILGDGITENKWEELLAHANTCRPNEKPRVCPNYESDHRVILDNVGQTADGPYYAANKFSLKQKGKAREFNDETFSGSMQKKRARVFSSQVSEGQIEDATAVQHNSAAPANAGSPAEGRSGVTLASSALSQNTNSGNSEYSGDSRITTVHMPTQPHDINSHYPLPSRMIGPPTSMVHTEDHYVPFSEPPHAQSRSALPPLEGNHVMAETQPTDLFGACLDDFTANPDGFFDAETFFPTALASDADALFDSFHTPLGADDVVM